jgi:hypothetical protein
LRSNHGPAAAVVAEADQLLQEQREQQLPPAPRALVDAHELKTEGGTVGATRRDRDRGGAAAALQAGRREAGGCPPVVVAKALGRQLRQFRPQQCERPPLIPLRHGGRVHPRGSEDDGGGLRHGRARPHGSARR